MAMEKDPVRRVKRTNMESRFKENKGTVQGLGTPVPVQVRGGQAGRTGSSTSDCGSFSVETQAGESIYVTGIETNKEDPVLEMLENCTGPNRTNTAVRDPFVRRDSITRTPPKVATNSFSHAEDNEKSGNSGQENWTDVRGKRKRMEKKSPRNTKRKDVISVGEQLKNVLKNTCRQIRTLEKTVGEMYKPKKEVLEAATSLALNMEKLLSREVADWMDEAITRERGNLEEEWNKERAEWQKEKEAWHKEKLNLERQLRYAEEKCETRLVDQNPTLADVQCEACKIEQKREARRQALMVDDNYDTFVRITEEDWKDEIFSKVSEQCGNIEDAPIEYALLFPCNEKLGSTNKKVAQMIEKFGGRNDLIGQRKRKGELAIMVHSLGFPDDEGNLTHRSRMIYYPIISDAGGVRKTEEESILKSLKAVKNHMLQRDKTQIALPEVEGPLGVTLSRMLRFLFAGSNVEITIYKENDHQKKKVQRERLKSGQSDIGNTKRKPRSDALLVKMPHANYADILRTVRKSINPTAIGVDVQEIRKIRNGDLLVTVRNGSDKLEVLKNEIKNKIPEATTASLTSKKVLHIKGLDEVTTVEEVKEAIVNAVSAQPENIEVRALRPAYGNKQNATVILSEINASKLVHMGKVKIGWTMCRILERKTEQKCFRCWKYGHTKAQCNGPDREKACLKCGQNGHKAIECQNKAFCVHCKIEGHQSGNLKCPNNKERGTSEIPRPMKS